MCPAGRNHLLRGQWTAHPNRLVDYAYQFSRQIFPKDIIQTHKRISENAGGLHGVEQPGKFKAKVAAQADKSYSAA